MHWIQAKKSHEDGQPIHKVRIAAVHDDGQVEIEGHDLKLTLWYHDPDHLCSALRFDSYASVSGWGCRMLRWLDPDHLVSGS